jgi:UDP-N-acetylmuramyl pentapeptide phosphotransferase/UDP-N-acetylglucosamine-1-phosphate transferase
MNLEQIDKLIKLFLISGVIFLVSFILTWFIKRLALHYKVMDVPNERSSHLIATPRGGGLAIVLAWYAGITIMFFSDLVECNLYFALMSGLLLAAISLIDDIFTLKPGIRLLTQSATAIIAFALLHGIDQTDLSFFSIKSVYILYPVSIMGIVWFINLFNFLDGIDGYASLEAITISMAMYLFTGNIVCLILIFSVMGFLMWNWPKAKIFMGDIGSTQLGFILIILGIYFHNKSELSIINWIMLSSLFWFDATLTLYRRWRNKEKLTVAHRKHAYQRIVQSGFSHQKTIISSLAINIIIIGLVLLSKQYDFLIIPLFLINMLFLYLITKLIDKKIPFK